MEQNFKVLPGDQKSESIFSRIQSGKTTETSGYEFCAWFCGTETSGLKKTTEIHTEDSVERKPENFPKFRAKMNYCVESWNFEHKSVGVCVSIVRSGIWDSWPRSPGFGPWPGPLPRKRRFFKYNLSSRCSNSTCEGSFERSQRENTFKLVVMTSWACGLLLNPAKVPNLQYRAWWYFFDQEFHADGENPQES